MNISRNIRTPIMHRAVEANGLMFVGGTIADDTGASIGEQTAWEIAHRASPVSDHPHGLRVAIHNQNA